ncbi:MAG: glutamate--cysteine ligase [Sphingomonadaceae bacterium]|uniref:glutamate--cysteine ligase n=1 Tax=Thermaurantiacus sp. TaxID=2820283 RepID=UPI00298EF98B|nr:glutamate--cysteine ligase [Thermaurantiacus sp.]MCS6986738.1 glutamate--cysteine ligase [Sphingomonadaceae bacterium]MDW8413999.1 glutamate--cysteine ligase [Thermaurantiacus sp.]
MTTRTEAEGDSVPVEGFADLVAYLESGGKPPTAWRIGTEHEKFVFRLADRRAPTWEEPGGIRDLLLGFTRYGWEPVEERGRVIALRGADGGISLEPAGQLELSGALRRTIHETCAEVSRHLAQCRALGGELGLGFLGLGFHPTARRDELPLMPKGRYAIMQRYMPKVGALGLDMMFRTCTTQVNLDFADEADMVRKFRVGLALQPLATALFANSPFTEGRPNGFLSYRAHVWTDTDPDRTGMLPFVFEEGFGFERYALWALDVPMYFVFRGGRFVDCAGASFRDFLAGRLPCLPGERPTLGDWKDHLSTLFPEVRLKTFLEMRGADGGPEQRICALPAFWVGLLYDAGALDAAWDLVKGWTADDRERLRRQAPRLGLATPTPDGRTLRDLALEVLFIAEAGLGRRAALDAGGASEAGFLAPMWDVAQSGRTLAERHLEAFHGRWGGSIEPVFEEARF